MAQIKSGQVVTPGGQSDSAPFELGTDTLVGVYFPSAIDASEVALQAGETESSFAEIRHAGQPLRIAVVPDSYVALDPIQLLGARYVRIAHLDGAGSPLTESADRSFTTVFRSFE